MVVDPAALPPPDRRVAVTGVTVDARPRALAGPLTLRPADGGPTFEFAAPLTAPGAAPVAYRLAGLDDRWALADDGRAVFPRLPAGRYTFEVRSGGASAALPVRVLAPAWRRPWALALWALAALGLAVAAYRVRVGMLLREAQTRRQIADDLHDEMGSRLGALATTLDLAALRVPHEAQPVVAARADDARALLGDLRDTVWAVDAGHATLADLGERIRQTAEALLPDVDLAVDVDGRGDLSMRERRHVLYVAKEALHNAARHARPTAVGVRLALGADGLRLTVTDDGPGLASGRRDGRGLASMQRRADALGGTLAVESAPGGGTRVALHVPRGVASSREAPSAPAS
jgi:signal transduction histidine kinase